MSINSIIKRLEIIKNNIALEETEEIERHIVKLEAESNNQEVVSIINNLRNKQYSIAINKINKFLQSQMQVSLYQDTEIVALKLEIKALEDLFSVLANEKADIEKTIEDFLYQYHLHLGELILEALKLKKEKLKKQQKEREYTKAEQEEKEYEEQFKNTQKKEKNHKNITPEEKEELKKKYRKASTMCHPDKVSEDLKAKAQEIFVELNNAYQNNDIKKVSEILIKLENNNFFTLQSDSLSNKDKLKEAICILQEKIDIIKQDIVDIKMKDLYKEIISIANKDEYFKVKKTQLKIEIELLKETI